MIFYPDVDTPLVRAIREKDISTLRKLAFSPGGYGNNEVRKKVWPILVAASENVTLLDGKGNIYRVATSLSCYYCRPGFTMAQRQDSGYAGRRSVCTEATNQ